MAISKNIDVWPDWDNTGRWCLNIKKKRGTLSLEEITKIATEWEEDFYAVIIKAVSEDGMQYFDDIESGDFVRLYRATVFLRGEK